MKLNLPFYTIDEGPPLKNGEALIYLHRQESIYGFSAEVLYGNVELQWAELDEDGEEIGCNFCHGGEEEVEGCKLIIMLCSEGGRQFILSEIEDALIMRTEEFWDITQGKA